MSNSNNQLTTLNFYIGHTCTTLSRRLTCHMSIFSSIPAYIDEHMRNKQNNNNTKMLNGRQCKERLPIQ